MATATENNAQDANQKVEFSNKIERMKKEMGVDTPEHMIDFALKFSPLGAEKAASAGISNATKEYVPKIVDAVKHLPETLQAAKAALPQTVQDALPMSTRDLAHLMFTPQNPSPERLAKAIELRKVDGDWVRHAKMQIATVPYASATYGGSAAYAASKVMDYAHSKERHYDDYATRFLHTANQDYKQQENLADLKAKVPDLAKPIDKFLEIQDKLAKDGDLSLQHKRAMELVAENFSTIIRTEGPESKSFDSIQKNMELSR
jgi:hypothetical protein